MTGDASPAPVPGPVLVMGAGLVGGYLGGCLQAAGVTVDFVARQRVVDGLSTHGLRLTDLAGRDQHLPAQSLRLHTRCPRGAHPALVMLCVKRPALLAALRELNDQLPPGTPVLCWQNGLFPAEEARQAAPALNLLPAMVPFNVAQRAPGHLHQGTAGELAAQAAPALQPWLPVFARAGLPLSLHADLRAVQWGKLMLNLNNPVNALSGLPLRAQLLDARHRRRFAALVEEALGLLRRADIEPQRMTPLPWDRLVQLLRLPTPLFRLLAARMLRIDSHARSSMADDLAAGRRTEIDALSGEVLRLAQRLGTRAPLNAAIVEEIRARESGLTPQDT